MKSNFQERQENRLEAFQALAAKNEQLSVSLWKQSNEMASFIPMGQPILVGHHSEKRDRNYRAKINNKMGQSVEADKKAAYYRDRAESLLNNTAISSDDPNALDRLEEKLKGLIATQELYKAVNKIVRKKCQEAEKVVQLQALGLKESTALELLAPGRFGGMGIAGYKLTNNNAVIRNTKLRIQQLTKIATLKESEEVINGVTLKISPDDNRVQLFFPGKPSEEVRNKLNSAGFRWAPSVKAWMRMISNGAIWQAKNILNNL